MASTVDSKEQTNINKYSVITQTQNKKGTQHLLVPLSTFWWSSKWTKYKSKMGRQMNGDESSVSEHQQLAPRRSQQSWQLAGKPIKTQWTRIICDTARVSLLGVLAVRGVFCLMDTTSAKHPQYKSQSRQWQKEQRQQINHGTERGTKLEAR